jgi:hypothetical protein
VVVEGWKGGVTHSGSLFLQRSLTGVTSCSYGSLRADIHRFVICGRWQDID